MTSSYCVTFNLHAQFALINACFVLSPIPLGSTVLLESHLDKKEGRKIFISCKVTSTDGSKVHTETTGNVHVYTPNVSGDDIMLVSKLAIGHISALLLSVSSPSCSSSCLSCSTLSVHQYQPTTKGSVTQMHQSTTCLNTEDTTDVSVCARVRVCE